jgi:hypothetical protein
MILSQIPVTLLSPLPKQNCLPLWQPYRPLNCSFCSKLCPNFTFPVYSHHENIWSCNLVTSQIMPSFHSEPSVLTMSFSARAKVLTMAYETQLMRPAVINPGLSHLLHPLYSHFVCCISHTGLFAVSWTSTHLEAWALEFLSPLLGMTQASLQLASPHFLPSVAAT